LSNREPAGIVGILVNWLLPGKFPTGGPRRVLRTEPGLVPVAAAADRHTAPAEARPIAKVLCLDERDLDGRVESMLRRLTVRTRHDAQRA
jgi:hypothetical protein